jgi:phage-related protein
MLTWAEDMLTPGPYVRFQKPFNKLSAEGFIREEKTAAVNIRNYEAEIEALEQFLKKEDA